MVTGLWYTHDPNFGSLSWFWRCKEHPCPLSPHLGLWRTLQLPDWGFASSSWFRYGQWSLIYLCSKFWLSIFILKMQRTSMSFKSSFETLENTGGSWLGFDILILIWIWSWALLGSSLKFWSHSDQQKLRYSQYRISFDTFCACAGALACAGAGAQMQNKDQPRLVSGFSLGLTISLCFLDEICYIFTLLFLLWATFWDLWSCFITLIYLQ